MCSDCREQNLKRKIEQFEEPREICRGTRKRSEKAASRKVLLDRLNQARKDLINEIERWEEHPEGSWWRSLTFKEWRRNQYWKALRACWDAGIDVKA